MFLGFKKSYKSLIICSAIFFASVGAQAKNVSLNPGESISVGGDTIYCESGTPLPTCAVRKGQSYYGVYVGSEFMEWHMYLDDALKTVQKLRVSNLCR